MFTIYIHVLEVLAMHANGASMIKIGEMGSTFSMVHIQKAVRELEKEGFITRHRVVDGRVYKITEKAIEYCETVVRKHENEIAYHRAIAKNDEYVRNAIAPHQDAVTGDLDTPPATMRHVTKCSRCSVELPGAPSPAICPQCSKDERISNAWQASPVPPHSDEDLDIVSDEHSASETRQDAPGRDYTRILASIGVVGDNRVQFPLYGNLTIAEVIEAYEANAFVKVVRADCENDIVTLTFEPFGDDRTDDYDPDIHGYPDEIYSERDRRDESGEW